MDHGMNHLGMDPIAMHHDVLIEIGRVDMALDEVRELLRFKDAPGKDCANVNALLDEHIGHVSQRIRELRALERELRVLRARCESPGHGKDCGILGGLGTSSGRTSKTTTQRHVRGTH